MEVNNKQPESLKDKMASFNDRFLTDKVIPQTAKDEFRLLMQELENGYDEKELKCTDLIAFNEILLHSLRINKSNHIFVDEKLLIKRYFSHSDNNIHLVSCEVGEPLENVSGQVMFSTLIDRIKTVIIDSTDLDIEVASDDNRWFNILVVPRICQTDKKIHGAIVGIREITNLKLMQEKLEDRNNSLSRMNEDLDNFVYTASRHLLEPLAHLEGLLELLKLKIQSGKPDVSAVMDMVEAAFGQFRMNISELDEIGIIEAQMLRSADPVSFEWLLEDLKLGIFGLLESSRVTFFTDFAVREINYSKKSLRSVLYNLITTSLRFKSPARDHELYLTTYSVPGYVVLMVRDNGVGIVGENLQFLFSKNATSHQDTQKHGLGMYLVKKIVESSGGRIEVEGEAGEGTVFRIFLRFDGHIH